MPRSVAASPGSIANERLRKSVTDEFNHALRCGLAVSQAIDQLPRSSAAELAPVTVRAYYFGKALANDAAVRAAGRRLAMP